MGHLMGKTVVGALIMGAVATVLICPLIGIISIAPVRIFTEENIGFIYLTIRLPRVFTAILAGGGLAVAGMIYQAVFRNPLADAYTLGVSSGASLGAAICIIAGVSGSIFGMSLITLAAFTGALGTVGAIYCFAWSRESNSNTLLLAGVIVATLCSGIIMFLHFIGGLHKSFQIMRWIMGGVEGVSFSLMTFMVIPLVIFLVANVILSPQLDVLLTGDSIAHSRGIDVRTSRNVFITLTAIAVGGIVAVCGPIGFVGIVAPHTCRLLLPGARHRMLGTCSFLLGGIFLAIADTIARTIAPPSEIPVGIITSLIGGPCFLFLLLRRKSWL